MMKPTCDDTSLLPLNDPSEYSIICSEYVPSFLYCSPNFEYFIRSLTSVFVILISSF